MDNKRKVMNYLTKTMFEEIAGIDALVRQYPEADSSFKNDGSPVTKLDLALSKQIELLMEKFFPGVTFYSEENYSDWKFPLMALDPLDGTQEYIEGRDEWALSIGVFETEKFSGEGWVYNPKTKELFDHGDKSYFIKKAKYRGEVSRSEWKQGLFTNKNSVKYEVGPMGSIAYKLGRLSAHKCDFVVSLRPKNIWDIAGGTILCQEAGYKFYSQGKEVTSVQKLYQSPLIWCHPEMFAELSKIYP